MIELRDVIDEREGNGRMMKNSEIKKSVMMTDCLKKREKI